MIRRRDLLTWFPLYGLAGALGYLRWNYDDGSGLTEGADADRATNSLATSDPRTVEPGEALADFDAWDVLDGTATVAGECAEGAREPCLRLERGSRRSRIARRFERPLDLTGVRPTVALTASENAYPRIQLFDVDDNELRLRAPVRGGLDYQPFNFGIERVVGDPDLSQIVEIRFNQSASPTVWLGRVEFHEPLPPTVLIAFDDAHVSNNPNRPQLLREYDYPATIFVNTGSIGGDNNPTVDQLASLERAGWDVCNYTVDQFDLLDLDADGQRHQVVGGRRWLLVNNFESGADYFTYPESSYDQTTLDIVDEYHRLAFAGGFPAAGAVPNHLLVPRIAVSGGEEARRMIDLTARFGGVTCLFYNDVTDSWEQGFHQTVEHLHERETAGDVDVATASDLAGLLES